MIYPESSGYTHTHTRLFERVFSRFPDFPDSRLIDFSLLPLLEATAAAAAAAAEIYDPRGYLWSRLPREEVV